MKKNIISRVLLLNLTDSFAASDATLYLYIIPIDVCMKKFIPMTYNIKVSTVDLKSDLMLTTLGDSKMLVSQYFLKL